jgi:hypothetical protein
VDKKLTQFLEKYVAKFSERKNGIKDRKMTWKPFARLWFWRF